MELVSFLLNPSAYPHPVKEVKYIQTHISWLFLTGKFVYKVKKPINLGFLDFTTLDKRHFFCEEELRLNRRLSPDVYLEVVPIVKKNNALFIDARGEVIDYAVKMKQLPQTACLSDLLEKNKVNLTMVQKIAKVMADFYLIAETNKEIATYGLPEKIWVNVKENFDQTASYINHIISKDLYNDLRDYSLSFLTEKKQWFLNRIANGQIKDGHGDFHCANIYYYKNQVYVLDCIEFNKRFRYADVGADVAFLLMDLDFRSASTLGNYFLNSYLAQNNDFSLLSVLNFYKIYRAYVRGKINSFKTNMAAIAKEQKQEAYRQAKAYFSLAHSYLFKPSYPYILATTGLLGSGKTTLALALAAHLGAIVIHSDAVRKHLAGVSPNKHLYAPFAKGIYAEEMTERVYEKLIFLSSEILSYGYTVILDASFNKEKYRHKLRKLAQKMGLPYYFLYCQCDEDIIKGRLEQRQKKGMDISDAYLGLFDTFKKGFEPLVDKRQFKVKTDESIQRAVEKIIRYFNET